MRFLFSSAQLVGHLDWGGFLATVAELGACRGHEVHWASGLEVQSMLTANGVTAHLMDETGWRWPLPPPLSAVGMTPVEFSRQRTPRSLD